MATTTLTTQSVFADARGARLRWVIAAVLAMVAIVAGQLIGIAPAAAAAGVTVTMVEDGTGQGTSAGCQITGPGGDNNDQDGVVCTQDTVRFRWGFDIPSNEAATVTMTQELPVGLIWQSNNVSQCFAGVLGTGVYTGTGTITNDGRTLTCTIDFSPTTASRAGFFDMFAFVQPTVPDGTVMNSTFSSEQGGVVTPLPVAPVTVRSEIEVNLIKKMWQDFDRIRVNVSGAQMGSENVKGIAAMDSPFTFVDDLAGMPASTTLAVNNGDCRLDPSTGQPSTAAAGGTWFCTQAGPGQPIYITVTGADASGGVSAVQAQPNSRTVFAGEFQLLVPQADIPAGGLVVQNQLANFAPTAGGGTMQNYDGNWEPGGGPYPNPVPCTPTNDNCASFTLMPYGPGANPTILKSLNAPGVEHRDSVGHVVYLPEQAFTTKISYIAGTTSQSNVLLCEKFDPTKQQLTGAATVAQSGGSDPLPAHTIEYGVAPLVNGAGNSVETAQCGSIGDPTTDGPWYSSIAAAGGAQNVSSVRVTFAAPVANTVFDFLLPMVNVSNTAADLVVDYVGSKSDTKPWANDNSAQYAVSLNILTVDKRAYGEVTRDAVRNEILPFTILPTLSAPGSVPTVVTVVDPLDSCYLDPTPDEDTLEDWTVVITPAQPGPDGVVCSADDVSGPILEFTSPPVTPNNPLPMIRYTVRISPASADNSLHANTATISAEGNTQAENERRSTQWTSVRGPGLIALVKFVDAPRVQVAPDPIGFSAQWSNLLDDDAGETQWIDILPYNGDGRGTSFHGTLRLSSLTLLGTPTNDVTIEYTSAGPASVNDDPDAPSNQPAGATTWCLAGAFGTGACPANLGETTAIRITVGNLTAGRQGGVHFTMQPAGNLPHDVYQNYVGVGRSDFPNPVPQSNQVRVDVVASSIGDTVWWDLNRDGIIDPVETGIPGVTVRLFDSLGAPVATTTTDANGLYLFNNLRSGDYRVEIDPTTLPYQAEIVPTYDLDGGTASPNGNSGVFPLGIDEDRRDVDFGYDLPDTIDGTPYIQTTASTLTAAPNASVTDEVQFTDVTGGIYTWTLYGPVAPVTPGTCVGIDWSTAPALSSGNLGISGTSTRTTPPVQLSGGVGCYTYSGSFAVTSVPGTVLAHPRGLTNETIRVEPGLPTVSTVALSGNNRPGATVSDNVAITGLAEDSTYTWSLLGPLPPVADSCDTVVWTGTPPVAFTGSFDVEPGTTAYTTGSRTVTDVGCYTYSGNLAATPTSNAVASLPGQQIESFRISANAPTITTTASTLAAGPTEIVHDNFTVGGLGGQSATYSWTLVGPVPAVGGSCTAVVWTGAPVFAAGSQVIPGDGDYVTSDVVLGNAGCYSYTGALAATATSDPATQPAGHVDETILVTAVTPDVTTAISSRNAAAGSSVTDTVSVDGLLDPTSYDWALLGPVAAVGGVCPSDPAAWTAATVVAQGTISIPADGDHATPAVALPAAGCFTYIGTLQANDKSNSVVLPAGVPEETVLASTTTPTITTTASTNVSSPLATVSDSVVISGLGTQNVTYTWVLYGPMNPVTPGTCVGIDWTTAAQFDTGTVAITGDGTFSTPSSTLGNAGCYTYTGSLPATATTDAFTTPRGITAETVRVDANTPTITTQASTNVALSGATVTDSVVITGLGTQSSTYTWSLLGPLAPVGGLCDTVDWTPAVASPFATGSFPVNGDNTYTTPGSVVTAVGCYTYVGTLAATGTTNTVSQAPGVAAETVRVDPRDPTVVTQASSNTASPGVSLTDSVQVSGLNGESAVYTWTLVGPVAPVTPGTCVGIVWPSTPIAGSGSLQVIGNGTYTTGATTLNDAGCYSYTGQLAGTATSLPETLLAGVPAETVIVAANTPTIVTDASPNTGAPGVVVSDSVVITNLGTQASIYRWALMGPTTPVTPGTCAGIDWSTALTYESGDFPVAGNGTYTTPPSTLTQVGCYSYTSDLDATGSSSRFVQGAGVPEETVRVDANAATVTTAISDQTTTSGDSVTDSATVGGLNGEATTYHWTLLGPIAPVAGACPTDPAAWSTAAVVQTGDRPVTGNGMFSTTPAATLLAAGCYTYTGVLDPTGTSTGVTLAPGDPLETTLVTAAVPTIVTTVSAFTGALGATVTDQVVLTGPIASGTVYSWRLYGPVPPTGAACPTDPTVYTTAGVYANGTITTAGAGTYNTTGTSLTAVGCFSYGGTIAPSVSSTEVTQDPGLAQETVRIAPDLPGIDTVADDGSGKPGATVSDSVVITGMGAATADYTWNLLGPLAIPAAGGCAAITDWSGAATLFTGTLTGVGNGTHTTPDRTLPDVGCYSYTGSLAASATTAPVSLPAGDIDETFAITAFTPTVATAANAAAQPGATTTDSVMVSGTGGPISATYSWTLVFAAPDGAGTCAAVDWTTATAVASGSYTITGDGTTTTAPANADAAGCYSYTGSLAATATTDAVVLPAGDLAETFLLDPFDPTVATTATINAAEPGDLVADGIEVTNFGIDPAQYDWTLLGPIAPVAGACSTNPGDWVGAAVLDAGTFTVNPGTANYQTSDSTLPLPGCYSYTGALAATASSSAVTLAAGDPLETVLVAALVPTASTLISSKLVYVGDQVRDEIFLGNTRGATPVVTWDVVGPESPVAGTCDTVDWTGATIAFSGVLTTLGDGTYVTPLVTLPSEGCYSYVTRIAATATTTAVTLAAGDPDETVKVQVRPAGLASTGGGVQGNVLLGAFLALGLGLAAVAFGRRRRRSKHSATS